MKIAVCISHVPDTATRIKIGSDRKSIDSTGVTYILNPYDEFAIEEALKTKDKLGSDTVVYAISVGGEANKETIRKALAMGVDEGVLLKDDSKRDSFGIAHALSEEIKSLGCEIVFFGKQSVDFDNSITGQLTAEYLGFNCIPVVVDFKLDGNKVIAEREIEGGREVVETEIPVVITAQKGLNEPRYASLKGIMAAKKKSITEKPAAAYSQLTETLEMNLPPSKQPGRILGTDSSAVPELVKLLREEAKVI
ncbi:MAG: electron transfer flavoprotein subunit beta/FixA family protein [Ignavibacteriota bacterium]|jgi:electron transfer flavoprotein beta subunit|nr:MAG: electron transfer flavoprotein subunit beta/FixA family protein [Ignavibacterium sp.]MBL1154635.1 electron transfer flavoprotein beta subunit/FixA family protein [Ignavibacteriota bacterium]MCO6447608.1 electron transfer flavoprotein subunit beta/FixA family protein [Ignavibacterium album]MCZ2269763.1 electron transfer flavoprotein subunit beta/FixA family protein [Ignavibacteriales bacterium]MDX9711996.1 electron transfer flavoprotein subunit beta/FixA family protein [Ignavibacteriacea